MDIRNEKAAHDEHAKGSDAVAQKLSEEAQQGIGEDKGNKDTPAKGPKASKGETLEATKDAFAVIDELESRRIPGTSMFICNGSHSNGYDYGTRWGGCLSDRNASDGLWKAAGERGGAVERSLKQSDSDVKNDNWSKKEIVFGEDSKDAIASRVTRSEGGHEVSSLYFESLGHLYKVTTDGDQKTARRLPDQFDVANPDQNVKGASLTDEKSIEYRAVMNKAYVVSDGIELLPPKEPVDSKAAIAVVENMLNSGKTRQAAVALQDLLVSSYKDTPDGFSGEKAQEQILKEIEAKTANGHGAKLHLDGHFKSQLEKPNPAVSIDPPSNGEGRNQPHFTVSRWWGEDLEDVAKQTGTDQSKLEKLNPSSAVSGAYPGFVLELPKKQ